MKPPDKAQREKDLKEVEPYLTQVEGHTRQGRWVEAERVVEQFMKDHETPSFWGRQALKDAILEWKSQVPKTEYKTDEVGNRVKRETFAWQVMKRCTKGLGFKMDGEQLTLEF